MTLLVLCAGQTTLAASVAGSSSAEPVLPDHQLHDIYPGVDNALPNTLDEYKNQAFSISLLALLLLFLIGITALITYTRHQFFLLLIAHLLATTTLILMYQGDRTIHWSKEPGFWVLALTVITFIVITFAMKNIVLRCFSSLRVAQNVFRSLWAFVSALAYYKSPGSFDQWINRKYQHRQATSINLVIPYNDKRRVFDATLRQHLRAPANALMDEKAIRGRILKTLNTIMPGTPLMILVKKKDHWNISSHYPKAAQILKSSIGSIEDKLMNIIGEHPVRLQDNNGIKYWVFLLHTEENHRTLLVISPGSQRQKSLQWQQITDISSHARTLFQANQQTRFWKQQASLDALTGLLNRRAFMNEAAEWIHRKDPEQSQSCLIFIDIDDFKQINDRFGHPAGDKVLAGLAHRLRKALRQRDLIARYGGEEFVALLPFTDALKGVRVAERLKNTALLYKEGPVPVSISLGIAVTGPNTDTLEKLLKEADDALYKAKHSGKNQVCRAPSCADIQPS